MFRYRTRAAGSRDSPSRASTSAKRETDASNGRSGQSATTGDSPPNRASPDLARRGEMREHPIDLRRSLDASEILHEPRVGPSVVGGVDHDEASSSRYLGFRRRNVTTNGHRADHPLPPRRDVVQGAAHEQGRDVLPPVRGRDLDVRHRDHAPAPPRRRVAQKLLAAPDLVPLRAGRVGHRNAFHALWTSAGSTRQREAGEGTLVPPPPRVSESPEGLSPAEAGARSGDRSWPAPGSPCPCSGGS